MMVLFPKICPGVRVKRLGLGARLHKFGIIGTLWLGVPRSPSRVRQVIAQFANFHFRPVNAVAFSVAWSVSNAVFSANPTDSFVAWRLLALTSL